MLNNQRLHMEENKQNPVKVCWTICSRWLKLLLVKLLFVFFVLFSLSHIFTCKHKHPSICHKIFPFYFLKQKIYINVDKRGKSNRNGLIPTLLDMPNLRLKIFLFDDNNIHLNINAKWNINTLVLSV